MRRAVAREAAIDRTMLIYFGTIAIAAVVTLRRPGAAAGVLLCTYALEQWAQSQSAWFFVHGTMTNIITASLMLLALLVQLQRGRPVLMHLGREFWLVLALTSLMLASVTWSISPSDTIAQFKGEALYYGVFVFLMPLVLIDRNDVRDAFLSLLCVGTLLAVLLMTTSQWSHRAIVFQSGAAFVIQGLDHGNPLAIGSFGGYLALTALMLNFGTGARLWVILRYSLVLLGFALTVKSGSRGQTLAIIIAGLAFLPYSRRFQNISGFFIFAISAAMLLAGLMVIFDSMGDLTDSRWSLDDSVNAVRSARIGTSLTVLGEWASGGPFRWIFGLGSSASWYVIGFYPHMVPAETLAELGIIGFALFCAIIFFAYRCVREIRPLVRDDLAIRGVVAALAAMLLFEFILSMKEGSLIGSNHMLGVIAVLGRVALNVKREAVANAEIEAAGYAMTDEERLLEDEAYLDELYEPEPVGSRG